MEKGQSSNISELDHIGILVEDIQRAADFYSQALNMGPFHIFELDVTEDMLKGVSRGPRMQGKLKIGVAPWGRIVIELLEVIEGGTIYKEFLDANGSMLHHLGFEVKDLEKELAEMEARGVEVPFSITHSQGGAAFIGGGETGSGMVIELVQAEKPLLERLAAMQGK